MDIMNGILTVLPPRFRRPFSTPELLREQAWRPTIDWFDENDPSESGSRSADIVNTLKHYFDVIDFRPYGGAICTFFFPESLVTFLEDGRRMALLHLMALLEDLLEKYGVVESDFAAIVAPPRVAPPGAHCYAHKEGQDFRKESKLSRRRRETQDMPDPRTIVPDDRQRLMQLLRYSNPFAISPPIEENPASPSDFVDIDYQSYQWLFDAAQLPMDPTEIREALREEHSPIPATIRHPRRLWRQRPSRILAEWLYRIQALNRHGRLIPRHWWGLFDFGGSTGRVFRHFHFQSAAWRIWSSDFKMTWVNQIWRIFQRDHGVPGNVFPFPACRDRTFDLVSAMSVSTHIDEIETSWLLELRRIMKPGGIAIVTIHE